MPKGKMGTMANKKRQRERERWNKINRRGGGGKRSEGTLTETQQVWRKEWMKDDKKREAQCEKE